MVTMVMGKYCAVEELWEYESAEAGERDLWKAGTPSGLAAFSKRTPGMMDCPPLPGEASARLTALVADLLAPRKHVLQGKQWPFISMVVAWQPRVMEICWLR